jgi:hypothetical protein
MVSIKEEKTSVVTEDPVEKTEREVNSNVSLCVLFKSFYRIVLDCMISTASALRFLLPQTNRILVPPLVSGVFVHNCLNFAPFFFLDCSTFRKIKQTKVVSSEIRQFPAAILI